MYPLPKHSASKSKRPNNIFSPQRPNFSCTMIPSTLALHDPSPIQEARSSISPKHWDIPNGMTVDVIPPRTVSAVASRACRRNSTRAGASRGWRTHERARRASEKRVPRAWLIAHVSRDTCYTYRHFLPSRPASKPRPSRVISPDTGNCLSRGGLPPKGIKRAEEDTRCASKKPQIVSRQEPNPFRGAAIRLCRGNSCNGGEKRCAGFLCRDTGARLPSACEGLG